MQNNYSRSDWKKIHDRAAGDYIRGEWTREILFGVGRLRRKLLSRATGDVLDVGCGYGINFPYLVNAESITGVDFSSIMLARGRELAARTGIKADLREGDAEALDFSDHSFDTVISSLATCSFYDPIKALKEMRRVCKPQGHILLLEHGRSTWKWLGRYQDRHMHQQMDEGGCRWNQEPQELVQEAGLKLIEAERTMLGILHTMVLSP
jgi:ubiquinone/menaquinone biosynthesis C-methylase UbiE